MLLVEYTTSLIAGYNSRPPTASRSASRQQRAKLAERRKMTRSAPPARTSPAPKHKASTRARTARTSIDTVSISLEDIYQSAERERLNYSSACRRQNLAHAQSQTQFFRTSDQGVTPRSYTSTSRHGVTFGREVTTPMSAWSEPMQSRPSSMVPHPELRYLEEDEDEDFEMAHHSPMAITFSPVGRDCCEIIGPQMCYECRKNRIRQVSKEKSDMYFPILEPSEDNLTTAAIVKKYLPGLSDPEIEDKLARGEIAKPLIRRQNNKTVEFSDEEDDVKQKPKITNKKVTIVDHRDKRTQPWTKVKTSELFFTNIRDLNNKIITGSVSRNIGFVNTVKEIMKKNKAESPAKNFFPSFVSPRKVNLVQETNYKTFFEPPLIEKAKQSVEPAFFAGSEGTYVLPEKLPDELVFVDKSGKEVKASSSQVFISKVSATAEGTGKEGKGASGKEYKSAKLKDRNRRESLDVFKEDEEEEEAEEKPKEVEEDDEPELLDYELKEEFQEKDEETENVSDSKDQKTEIIEIDRSTEKKFEEIK